MTPSGIVLTPFAMDKTRESPAGYTLRMFYGYWAIQIRHSHEPKKPLR